MKQTIAATMLLLTIFIVVEWFVLRLQPPIIDRLPDLMPGVTAKAVDTLTGLAGLFITFAMAVFGGIGFFLKSYLTSEVTLEREEGILLVASGLATLFSVFFGHLVYWSIGSLLAQGGIVFGEAIQVPFALQYLFLILAVIFLFASGFRAALRKGIGKAEPETPADKAGDAV